MDTAELIARAVLYEGYILYPYRPTALKNRHRWVPGGLVPRAYAEAHGGSEPHTLQAECLVRGDDDTTVSVRVRFLHPFQRTAEGGSPWQEATEREVGVAALRLRELGGGGRVPFAFPGERSADGRVQHGVEGVLELSAAAVAERVLQLTVRVVNLTPVESPAGMTRDDVQLRTFASAHAALRVCGGEFVSLTDPPADLRPQAAACRNVGVWPVLVGEPGDLDAVLASPVILADYPRVAPESPGDFFDATEIDELLALRVLTLTDAEKREMAAADPRGRAILERVESLPAARLAALHGAVRSACPAAGPRPGDRVRLRPRGRADALDVLLAGKAATVVAVEEDFEGATHLAVTVDDDPGRDLGGEGMPGHRFFFRPDEVEPLARGGGAMRRLLVAGVGNVFRGDDGFGPEVVRRLAAGPLPAGVRAADFGTRGHDLAYAILDGYDGVILIDAAGRGGEPGTLYALEPAPDRTGPAGPVGGHGVDLPGVFRLVRAMGGRLPRLYLVGCEPADLGPDDEGAVGLSPPVAAAVERAVGLVRAVVADALAESPGA